MKVKSTCRLFWTVLLLAGLWAGVARAEALPSMHVGRIQVGYAHQVDGSHLVSSAVAIHDMGHLAVPGAKVSVQWVRPGGDRLDQQALTDGQGVARFQMRSIEHGAYRLCVTGVAKRGLFYDPKRNEQTCAAVAVE